jgi:hypothetical protein
MTVSVACHFAVNSFARELLTRDHIQTAGSAFTIAKSFNIRPARPESEAKDWAFHENCGGGKDLREGRGVT